MVIIIVIHHVMQIKTIIAYCFTSNRTAIIKKTDNNNCQGRGELGTVHYATRKKPVTKDHTLYDSIYAKYLE